MLTVEVIAQPELDPGGSHALDVALLARAAAQAQRAWLRVYSLACDVLSLGRYHVAPAGHPQGAVIVQRRLGGGRVLPLGHGFVVVSLTLPHRSALVGDEPLALRPEQVLNRCVRALLAALRGLGVDAFYPGRDRITVGRRMLGCVSLECDATGATVFEAVLAVDGDWLALPRLIAAVDADGVIAAQILDAEDVTTLSAHGRTPSVPQLAHLLASAYEQQFQLRTIAVDEPPGGRRAVAAGAAGLGETTPNAERQAAQWLASRRLRPQLNRHGIAWEQLGVFEVYLEAHDGNIVDLLLAGDFIADSPSVARLEQTLRGCPLEREALTAAVAAVYADPRSFLLGVASLQTVVDTILSAA
jgi:hypothetical protein